MDPTGTVSTMSRSQPRPRFPVALEMYGRGSQVAICSLECMDELEGEWLPGVRLTHMARTPLTTGTCAACVVCGYVAVKVLVCVLHDDNCPERQWILTLSGMSAAVLAYELFGPALGDNMLETVERMMALRPDDDPEKLLRRLKNQGH